MVGLLLLPAPPLMAQAAPDSGLTDMSAEARLAQVTTDYAQTLSTAESTRLSNLCKTVQSILQQYISRTTDAASTENTIHAGVITRLGSLQSQFSVSNIDNPEFMQVVDNYAQKVTDLKKAYDLHLLLVGDAVAMDCASNPAGFRALIVAARAAQPDIAVNRAAAKAYLVDTVRPTIEQITIQSAEQQ